MKYKFEVRVDAGSVSPQVKEMFEQVSQNMHNMGFEGYTLGATIVIAKPVLEVSREFTPEEINKAKEIIRETYSSKFEGVEVILL